MPIGDIRKPFRHVVGDQFANLVEAHLRLVLPNVKGSMRLRDLDKQGIDVLHFDEDDGSIVTAIQCKGIEGQFKPKHANDFVKEVDKFEAKAPKVQEYWLALNTEIRDPKHRKKVLDRLSKLEASGHVDCALLLDIDHLARKLHDLAVAKFRTLARLRREQYRQRYLESFDNAGYIENVPARTENGTIQNPVALMAQQVRESIDNWGPDCTGPGRRYPRFFLTGSFGFGKTLGLHALGHAWHEMGDDALFVPAVSLHNDAFVHAAGIIDFLIAEIFSSDAEFSQDHIAYKTLREACKTILNKEQWMLLIDAIDESEFWNDPSRLQHLWFSIKEIGLPAVVTVRSELIDTRPEEFFGDEKVASFHEVQLTDWEMPQMLAFLAAFRAARQTESPASFDRFVRTVREGNYEARYGDIPRRPLFLQMLAEDAWSGSDPEEKLFRLYGKYFHAKLKKDWERADTPSKAVRLGRIVEKFGKSEARERMIQIMQKLALLASGYDWGVQSDGTFVEIKTTQLRMTEDEVIVVIEEVTGEAPIVEELLLNSLLQPAGRDPLSRKRLFKFAHQSFFDWFVARAIVQWSLKIEPPSQVISDFVTDMRTAVSKGEELP